MELPSALFSTLEFLTMFYTKKTKPATLATPSPKITNTTIRTILSALLPCLAGAFVTGSGLTMVPEVCRVPHLLQTSSVGDKVLPQLVQKLIAGLLVRIKIVLGGKYNG